jgi:hypothetical protein
MKDFDTQAVYKDLVEYSINLMKASLYTSKYIEVYYTSTYWGWYLERHNTLLYCSLAGQGWAI